MIKTVLNKISKFTHLVSIVEDTTLKNKIALREEILNYSALNCRESGITDEKYADKKIIVSLTTYGKRLNQVYLTIESLMQQSLKPNKIVLWINEDCRNNRLPQFLQQQTKRGLEIAFCKDIRAYKKLIPAMKKYPNDVIITADDDVYYNSNMIENLVSAYLQDPLPVYFNRGFRMKLRNNDTLDHYLKWESITSLEVSPFNFPTGVGGVLYPPGCLDEEVFNEKVFLNICPLNDDIWFKAMALCKGTQSKKAETISPAGDEFLVNKNVQDIGLSLLNNGQNQNDVQLKAVFEKYNLLPKLKECR
jgi:hypothetical protein